jgi:1,4-dihydroxy-2-naphthoate octaprenyltransferase
MLLLALVALTAGSAIGIVIVILTESFMILLLGMIGVAGGFFYTAPPFKLGYRCIGEIVIAMLFGILPVFASYYIQTKTFDMTPLGPALIVSILVFLIILINEFPDAKADAEVNKKTLVVVLGTSGALWIYRAGMIATYLVATAMLFYTNMFTAGLCYLLTLPLVIVALKFATVKEMTTPGKHRANAVTIGLHTLGSLALTGGLVYIAITAA